MADGHNYRSCFTGILPVTSKKDRKVECCHLSSGPVWQYMRFPRTSELLIGGGGGNGKMECVGLLNTQRTPLPGHAYLTEGTTKARVSPVALEFL